MKFKYTGDHDSITMYDITFPKGEAVEVDEKAVAYRVRERAKKREFDVLTIDKLKGNPEFDQVKAEIKQLSDAPKKRGRKPKVNNGDTSGSQKSSIKQA